MPRTKFAGMDVTELMELRGRVDAQLAEHRVALQRQLARLDGTRAAPRRGRPPGSGASSLKGRKVPPKYRGPSGETWAGRGARPRWLVAALKGGKKLESFLIEKSAGKTTKKRVAKA